MRLLFLCTANICRSPLAEVYLRHVAHKVGHARLTVSSAGILDYGGRPADPQIVRLAAERGLDLTRHRAHLVTPEEILASDRIVAMERRHRAWVEEHHAEAISKVSLLRQYSDGKGDVPDPTGATEPEYRAAVDILFRGVEKLAVALRFPR